jgi:hypothetical protein
MEATVTRRRTSLAVIVFGWMVMNSRLSGDFESPEIEPEGWVRTGVVHAGEAPDELRYPAEDTFDPALWKSSNGVTFLI